LATSPLLIAGYAFRVQFRTVQVWGEALPAGEASLLILSTLKRYGSKYGVVGTPIGKGTICGIVG